jgi:hypothetical protein
MAESHCPICYGLQDVRDVAPCYDCGHDPEELEHLAEGRHTYAEMRIFGINDPTSFGRTPGIRPEREMTFVCDLLNPEPAKNKYCPSCGHRLALLRFLAGARATTI